MVAPGYPEEVISECVPPEGYPDTWNYNIWTKGRWTNLGNITRCIDPNLCYDDPPGLPADFSVEWNQTTAKPNRVNTTLLYSCGRKCKLKYFKVVVSFFGTIKRISPNSRKKNSLKNESF